MKMNNLTSIRKEWWQYFRQHSTSRRLFLAPVGRRRLRKSVALTFNLQSADLYIYRINWKTLALIGNCLHRRCEQDKNRLLLRMGEIHIYGNLPLCCCWDLGEGFPAWGPLADDADGDWTSTIEFLDGVRTAGEITQLTPTRRLLGVSFCHLDLRKIVVVGGIYITFNTNETQMSYRNGSLLPDCCWWVPGAEKKLRSME